MASLVPNPNQIRLAMVGMVEGNGHPYSWSAIINGGFDAEAMARCPYPVIPQYLAAAGDSLGISGVKVTHIWCDDEREARQVAKASLIPNVVEHSEEVIGEVDAVVIPTDKPEEHLDRARPFIEAGVPLFIDKPLTDRGEHLRQFIEWHEQGKAFLSTSCMRYAREYADLRSRLGEIGELRLITMSMCKSWERYGIHGLEGVYPFLAPGGWLSAANTGSAESNIVHLRHACGVEVVLATIADLYGAFGCLNLYGTKGTLSARFADTFYAFKSQLMTFVDYLRTGQEPINFGETIELMKIVIAGIRSREQSGRTIPLTEIET